MSNSQEFAVSATQTNGGSDPSSSASADRSAKIAVTVFPLIILGALLLGMAFPAQTAPLIIGLPYALMIIMFAMGLTLTLPDFAVIVRRPWVILVGLVAQYVLMPVLAYLVTKVFGLDPALAVGVILVGCAPGGTASNVVSYLAKGDVALSVAMTSVSTLVSPIFTPLLTKLLADEYAPVNAGGMAIDIVKIVIVPIVAALLIRRFFPAFVTAVMPALPWISVIGISYAVLGIAGKNAEKILTAGLLIFAVVIVHNGLGLALGYAAGRVTRAGERASRTIAIEVGMQNSGLAAALGDKCCAPEAALPGAVFSVWHNVSGSALAAFFQRRPTND